MKILHIAIPVIMTLCVGCAPDSSVESMAGQSDVTTGNSVESSGTSQGQPSEPSAEYEAEMRQSFRDSQVVFSDGKVEAGNGSADDRRKAAIAQRIITTGNYKIGEGARVLVIEEPTLNRLIYQELLPDGKYVNEVTVLADKNTNERIVGISGFYLGPPPTSRNP